MCFIWLFPKLLLHLFSGKKLWTRLTQNNITFSGGPGQWGYLCCKVYSTIACTQMFKIVLYWVPKKKFIKAEYFLYFECKTWNFNFKLYLLSDCLMTAKLEVVMNEYSEVNFEAIKLTSKREISIYGMQMQIRETLP